MIIKQIRIFNYGKWHNATISLQESLNILYGRNEAGKTTLLSFVRGVLFGYLQRRTSHKNYIPRKSKNYGGQLEISTKGQDYIVQRMAGKNGGLLTILNEHGDRLDNSTLKKILGPFDRNTFDALYYFGTVDLDKVSKLKQRDLIYRIQRIGLVHSNDWIDYRENLNKDAKKIYTPRGYKPPLNQKLKQYSRLNDQIRDAKSGYTTYQELLKSIQQYHHDQQVIKAKLNLQEKRTGQVTRDQNTWLRYQKIKSLQPVMNQPILSGFTDDDANQLQHLKQRITKIQDHVKLIKQQIGEASSQIVNDESTHYYVKHLDIIKDLVNQFNDVERELQQLKLLRNHNSSLKDQLDKLSAKYSFNHHVLIPMNRDDYRSIRDVVNQVINNQKQIQSLSHRLLTFQDQKTSHHSIKDYIIYVISGLFILIGVATTLLMCVLGIVIGAVWFSYRFHADHENHDQIDKLRNDIHSKQQAGNKLDYRIHQYQLKYHYPDASIEKWLLIQDDLKRIVKLTVENKRDQQKFDQRTNDLNQYFGHWSFMNRQLTLSSDQSNQLLQLKNYVNKMHRIFVLNRQAEKQRQNYQQELKAVEGQCQTALNKLDQFYQERHVKDDNEFTQQQNSQVKLKQQQATYHELSRQIGDQEIATLRHYQSYDDIKTLGEKIGQTITDLKSHLQDITGKLTAVQVKLTQLVNNGSYDQLQQRAANARTEINSLVERWLEEALASQWIDASLNLATKGRVPKIEHQAQLNFKTLTNGRYISIIFNKSQIKVMRNDKQRFTLYELSKGTVQQLYLALIFAMAQVFGTNYPMPIMVDDGFTDFDVTRRKAAINLLKQLSNKLQVIYCTSDENFADDQNSINLSQIK